MDEISENSGNNNNGFTLVEVVIALLIFSISMMGLASLQLNSQKSVTKADIITQATALAHSQIETLKGVPMTSSMVTGNSEIEQIGPFWVQRLVTDDYPIGKRPVDTGTGVVNTTVCKTIEIKVFQDSEGENCLADSSFIKSYAAIE